MARPKGSRNKRQIATILAAEAAGKLPHEIMLERAREYRDREAALRQAAQDPRISADLQKIYLTQADELAAQGHVFAKDAAPFYAPKLAKFSGDKDAPLGGPPIVHIVNFKRDDCD